MKVKWSPFSCVCAGTTKSSSPQHQQKTFKCLVPGKIWRFQESQGNLLQISLQRQRRLQPLNGWRNKERKPMPHSSRPLWLLSYLWFVKLKHFQQVWKMKTWLTAIPLTPWSIERQGLWQPRTFKSAQDPAQHIKENITLVQQLQSASSSTISSSTAKLDFGENGVMQLLLPLPIKFFIRFSQKPAPDSCHSDHGKLSIYWRNNYDLAKKKKIQLHHLVTLEQLTKGALWGGQVDVLLQLQWAAGWGCLQGRKYWEATWKIRAIDRKEKNNSYLL